MMSSDKQPADGAVSGLDTLRLLAALWVALYHGAGPPVNELFPPIGAAFDALGVAANFPFDGIAAVMVFFVISGFVIHRPAAMGRSLDLPAYLARRLLRIVPPIFVAGALCALLGPASVRALASVLWSLACEVVYYLIYPALLLAFRRGWMIPILAMSAALAAALLALAGPAFYYWQLAPATVIFVGLPSWILGCALAERRLSAVAAATSASPATIWAWRFGAVALSAALRLAVVRFDPLLGYPQTHWLAAVFAFFWIDRELTWRQIRPAPRWTEALGRGSYSLYLVHAPTLAALGIAQSGDARVAFWLVKIVAVGAATLVFYQLCEAPSHRLARRLGARLAGGAATLSAATVANRA